MKYNSGRYRWVKHWNWKYPKGKKCRGNRVQVDKINWNVIIKNTSKKKNIIKKPGRQQCSQNVNLDIQCEEIDSCKTGQLGYVVILQIT